ncbi:MAG: hypothetical protein GXO90_06025 [FCB group bacterium]|nr:hypothetical protein [FCB group bacterium]
MGTLVAFLMATFLASRIPAQDYRTSQHDFQPGTKLQWSYDLNYIDQNLGDRQLLFADYWLPDDQGSDLSRNIEMEPASSRRSRTFFGVAGLGDHEFRATDCVGNMVTYRRKYRGFALGRETKISGEKKTKYRGMYGAVFIEDWTATSFADICLERDHNTFGTFNITFNTDRKYVGSGIGGFLFIKFEDNRLKYKYILPNFYLRIGPPKFSLEMGINDRTLIRPDPITLHVNATYRRSSTTLRLGIMPMGILFDAIFLDGSWRSASGLTWQPTIIITNGVGFNLKLNYTLSESGE